MPTCEELEAHGKVRLMTREEFDRSGNTMICVPVSGMRGVYSMVEGPTDSRGLAADTPPTATPSRPADSGLPAAPAGRSELTVRS
jgi:hypothetical protein